MAVFGFRAKKTTRGCRKFSILQLKSLGRRDGWGHVARRGTNVNKHKVETKTLPSRIKRRLDGDNITGLKWTGPD